MIMPDLPTLAFIVSLSTSQPMSKIKEKNVTLNPACRMSGRDGGQAYFAWLSSTGDAAITIQR